MGTIINTFDYTYGSGDQLNRRIVFSRTDSGKIQAYVFVLNGNGIGNYISTIPGDRISVKMQSIAQKIPTTMLETQNLATFEFKYVSKLSTQDQNVVLGSLNARKIAIVNKFDNSNLVPNSLTILDLR